MQPTLRSFDLAHLAHVELLTPKPDESLRFFVDVLGLTESGRRGDSVYLRGWDDYEHHTLKLTAAKAAGMGHFAFRTTSPEALQHRASIIEKAGFGEFFTHRTGHGLGMDVHESPYVVKGNKRRLAAGNVVTVEPGIYLENVGGVRIEDLVVVREGGPEILTGFTKELVTVH